MLIKKEARQRRARKTRARIAEKKSVRLAINRTNLHIYAQVISANGDKVLASASSVEAEVRKAVANGGNSRCGRGGQTYRREGKERRHYPGRFRPFWQSISWPCQSAG